MLFLWNDGMMDKNEQLQCSDQNVFIGPESDQDNGLKLQ